MHTLTFSQRSGADKEKHHLCIPRSSVIALKFCAFAKYYNVFSNILYIDNNNGHDDFAVVIVRGAAKSYLYTFRVSVVELFFRKIPTLDKPRGNALRTIIVHGIVLDLCF